MIAHSKFGTDCIIYEKNHHLLLQIGLFEFRSPYAAFRKREKTLNRGKKDELHLYILDKTRIAKGLISLVTLKTAHTRTHIRLQFNFFFLTSKLIYYSPVSRFEKPPS